MNGNDSGPVPPATVTVALLCGDIPSDVGVDEFGCDHWSLLLYLAREIAAHDGAIDCDRMRCNLDRHAELASVRQRLCALPDDGSPLAIPPGTRLHGYSRHHPADRYLAYHDDWDCLDDLIGAGLARIILHPNDAPATSREGITADTANAPLLVRQIHVELTQQGREQAEAHSAQTPNQPTYQSRVPVTHSTGVETA